MLPLSYEKINYKDFNDYVAKCDGNPQQLPNDFQEYLQGEIPSFPKWKYTCLYLYDCHHNKRIWQTGFDGIKQWVLHGTVSATTIFTYDIERNATGRSIKEQAIIKCSNEYNLKIKSGYLPLFNDDPSKKKLTPMTGHEYDKNKIKKWPVTASCKLDGHRLLCYLNTEDNSMKMLSKGNEEIHHIKHIKKCVYDLVCYLPPNVVVDGELYCHGMTRENIASIVRSYKNIHKDVKKIKYYIFDIYYDSNPCVEKRYEILANAFNMYNKSSKLNYLVFVPQWKVSDDKQLINDFNKVIKKGYEGLVIRHLSHGSKKDTAQYKLSQYHFGKSTRIYKLKKWLDTEGIVVDVKECTGKEKGLGIIVVRDDCSSAEIAVRYGTAEERKYWLKNKHKVIGRVYQYYFTHRHQDSNIPQGIKKGEFRDNYY